MRGVQSVSVCALYVWTWQLGALWELPWASLGAVVLQLIKFDLSGSTLQLQVYQRWLRLRWVATVGNIIGNSWPTGQLSTELEKSKHKASAELQSHYGAILNFAKEEEPSDHSK